MSKVQDVAVVTGTYELNGETKKRYQNVGVAFTNDKGQLSIKLESWFNPAGATNEKGECWINIFDKKEKGSYSNSGHQQAKQNGYQSQQSAAVENPDIPF